VKVGYLESHKSFYKLSFENYYENIFYLNFPYGKLKFERGAFEILLSLNKGFNK
jgi:hypothetical protein